MGTGCGSCSKKSVPLGTKKPAVPAQPTSEPKRPSTSMGGQTQSFRLQLKDGSTMRIQCSLLEAQSMLIRKGGGRIEL